jgi:hypothetical protein
MNTIDKAYETLTRGYPLKFCKDCKHRRKGYYTEYDCGYRITKSVNLLTGEMEEQGQAVKCETHRQTGYDCGPEGKLWEPKEKPRRWWHLRAAK